MKKTLSAKKLRLEKSTLRSLSREETRRVNGASGYFWCNIPIGPLDEAPRIGTFVPPGGVSMGGDAFACWSFNNC